MSKNCTKSKIEAPSAETTDALVDALEQLNESVSELNKSIFQQEYTGMDEDCIVECINSIEFAIAAINFREEIKHPKTL